MQTEGDWDQSDLEREAAIAEAKLIEQEMLKEMKEQEEREQQQRDENGNYWPLQDEYFRDEGDIRIKGLVESLDQGAKRTFDKLNSDEADKMLENVTVEFTINRHYFCKWKYVKVAPKKSQKIDENKEEKL